MARDITNGDRFRQIMGTIRTRREAHARTPPIPTRLASSHDYDAQPEEVAPQLDGPGFVLRSAVLIARAEGLRAAYENNEDRTEPSLWLDLRSDPSSPYELGFVFKRINGYDEAALEVRHLFVRHDGPLTVGQLPLANVTLADLWRLLTDWAEKASGPDGISF